jgi:uncharacterized membrane protein
VLWALIALQWLHILAGIFWFGSAMTVHVIAFPAFRKFPPETHRAIIEAFAARYGRLVGAVAGATILLGILRGVTGGVLNVLTSPYGLTWIAAIVLAVAIAGFEGARLSPTVGRLIAAGEPEQIRALDERLEAYGKLELGGFLVLFSLMIAMRFGY